MKTFIHIPKTGGTTIVDTLSRQVLFNKFQRLNPTRYTHPRKFLDDVGDLLEKVISSSKAEVVGGHFGFAAHPKLTDPSDYFTVLRDPIERVISEYYFMKHKGMFYQHLIESENLSLEEYIHHPETFYLNNLQTRLISGVSYQSGEAVTKEMYDLALQNLKKFKTFGITENMGSTLALFYLVLEWKRMPYYMKSNVNDQRPKRESISQQETDAISERDQYDVMLYLEAKSIFDGVIMEREQQISEIQRRIMSPHKMYKIYLKVLNRVLN